MDRQTAWRLGAASVVALGLASAAIWRAQNSPAEASPHAVSAPPDSLRASVASPPERPPPPPPAPLRSASVAFVDAAPRAEGDEAALMTRLRTLAKSSPEDAIALAREGNSRFPNGADAAERIAILVHSLADTGRASEARGEAEDMVNRFPDSPWVKDVERFTGAHRHRDVQVSEDGAVNFL